MLATKSALIPRSSTRRRKYAQSWCETGYWELKQHSGCVSNWGAIAGQNRPPGSCITITTEEAMEIRKQVYDLTPDDFVRSPIWEFALDEEGVDGQDEATVRPLDAKFSPNFSEGGFIVKARFVLADGSSMSGYLTPAKSSELDLGRVQPAIVTEKGQVSFWCGMVEPNKEYIDTSYKILDKQPAEIFPLFFSSDFPQAAENVEGMIPGFIVLLDFETEATKVVL